MERKRAANGSGWSERLGAALGGKHIINSHVGTAPSQGPDWAGGRSLNADIQHDTGGGGRACAAPLHLSSDKLLTPNRILTGFRGLELPHDEPARRRRPPFEAQHCHDDDALVLDSQSTRTSN